MGKTIGIIGGGQLGMMITEAAQHMPEIDQVIVLDPTKRCSAVQAGAKLIQADFKDRDAIEELARRSDIITYEIESGNSDVLKKMEKNTTVNPSPETLKIIQDKLLQKTFLSENDIAVVDFDVVNTVSDIKDAIKKFGYPVLLKARRDAYDGRGNYKIDDEYQVQDAYDRFDGQPLMVEKFVPFVCEVSVIAARNTHGDIATYPLVENIHKDHILQTTIAPARVRSDIAKNAKMLAEKTIKVLDGAGVFGIEMFVTDTDQLLINEIAPRVHNSGHHSLQSSKTSQFEQHLRAITGMPLGSTDLLYPTIMYNILGEPGFEGEYTVTEPKMANTYLKMYGKAVSKPKRKLGHINVVAKNGEHIDELISKVEAIKNTVIIKPR